MFGSDQKSSDVTRCCGEEKRSMSGLLGMGQIGESRANTVCRQSVRVEAEHSLYNGEADCRHGLSSRAQRGQSARAGGVDYGQGRTSQVWREHELGDGEIEDEHGQNGCALTESEQENPNSGQPEPAWKPAAQREAHTSAEAGLSTQGSARWLPAEVPAVPDDPRLPAERKLVRRVMDRCGDFIRQACKASSIPPEFLGALTANESGGNPRAMAA